MHLIGFWKIRPTSVLYFDPEYLFTTCSNGKEEYQKHLNNALHTENEVAIRPVRTEPEILEHFTALHHVVVLEFDTLKDYQQALKHQSFSSTVESRRYQDLF